MEVEGKGRRCCLLKIRKELSSSGVCIILPSKITDSGKYSTTIQLQQKTQGSNKCTSEANMSYPTNNDNCTKLGRVSKTGFLDRFCPII